MTSPWACARLGSACECKRAGWRPGFSLTEITASALKYSVNDEEMAQNSKQNRKQLVANICCSSLLLPGTFSLAHLRSYRLLWISGGKSACYQLRVPTGAREKSGVQPSRLPLSTHGGSMCECKLSDAICRTFQAEFKPLWIQLWSMSRSPFAFSSYREARSSHPAQAKLVFATKTVLIPTELCLPPEDWQSAHKCGVQQAKGNGQKTAKRRGRKRAHLPSHLVG